MGPSVHVFVLILAFCFQSILAAPARRADVVLLTADTFGTNASLTVFSPSGQFRASYPHTNIFSESLAITNDGRLAVALSGPQLVITDIAAQRAPKLLTIPAGPALKGCRASANQNTLAASGQIAGRPGTYSVQVAMSCWQNCIKVGSGRADRTFIAYLEYNTASQQLKYKRAVQTSFGTCSMFRDRTVRALGYVSGQLHAILSTDAKTFRMYRYSATGSRTLVTSFAAPETNVCDHFGFNDAASFFGICSGRLYRIGTGKFRVAKGAPAPPPYYDALATLPDNPSTPLYVATLKQDETLIGPIKTVVTIDRKRPAIAAKMAFAVPASIRNQFLQAIAVVP